MDINNKTTKAELEALIAQLQAENAALKAEKNESTSDKKVEEQQQPVSKTAAPIINVTTPSNDVVLVYCSNSMGYIKTTNVELYCNVYGEEFTLSRNQFDEVAGKYRSWFERGVLAVSSKNMDIAIAKGLPTDADNILSKEVLNSLGKMTTSDIEKLWNDLTQANQKHSIVSYVKRKFMDNDPLFHNREKVDLFNRLTEGAFRREQDELDGRYTYHQVNVD